MTTTTSSPEIERVESPFHRPTPGSSTESSSQPYRSRPSAVPEGFKLRPMTGYEEEYLEERLSDPNTSETCNQILARCLVAPGSDHRPALDAVRALEVQTRRSEGP